MTATDELRRLLDERGVELYKGGDGRTMWLCGLPMCYATEWGDDTVWLDAVMTPEQAVEATLGRSGYSYDQWREISDAVAAAMEYAHDKAIEYPDNADPLWNLDEYVNRILKVAFNVDGCGAKVV